MKATGVVEEACFMMKIRKCGLCLLELNMVMAISYLLKVHASLALNYFSHIMA